MRKNIVLKSTLSMTLLGPILLGCIAPNASVAAPLVQVAEARTMTALEQVTYDIKYMSSDEMGGRKPGTPGIKLCEDYIVQEYKKAGLKTLPNGTYLQELNVGNEKWVVEEEAELVLRGPDEQEIKLKLGENYRQLIARSDFDLDTELVFVGFGVSAEEHNYLDYADVDVKDKIVVLMRYEPQNDDTESVFNGAEPSQHASGRSKVIAARRAGAKGVIMVNNSAAEDDGDELVQASRFGTTSLPFAQVKRSVIDNILGASPLLTPTGDKLSDLESIEAYIDEGLEPISQPMVGWSAKFKSSFKTEQIPTNNVIGIIEGEGPNADETIIIGGHYDHLGNGGRGSRARGRLEIHNGADDNATGTAAVIELARRFARSEKKPGRRLMFVCFTGEEMGLLGARHYVENPIYPLEKTTAMINFDMIGWLRNNELTLYNWNTSKDIIPIYEAANQSFSFKLNKPARAFAGSDHLPFNQRQVPNVFIHTGLNPVYHTPEDDFEAINCQGALKVIDYSEQVIAQIAALEKKPAYGVYTPPRVRLGARLDDEDDVVTITAVADDSIAEAAELKVGDAILEINGKEITKRRQVVLAIRRNAGSTIELKVDRDGEEMTIEVKLVKDE